ncbi:hypothetical protein [Paenibacillus sp. BIC5C1]|nr:hypothetical protein [Paenibacillus sp. BIC5C1]
MLGSVELIHNWFQKASDGEAHASVRFGDASNTDHARLICGAKA